MDRMSALDASFFYAESENTPMHVGSVAVFEGPAPSYGDVVRLILGKLPKVPRYRQRVQPVPMQLGRPLWVDDPHFQILYHVRHTAVPRPGSDEQLRNLAGRVLGQRLDMAKPLWELWLVEGLADDRWALISKVHHCMVDGVAGTDLMQLMFDLDPDATHDAGAGLDAAAHARRRLAVMAGAVTDARDPPAAAAASLPTPGIGSAVRAAKGLAASGKTAGPDGAVARQAGDHPDGAVAQRPDRPAPALGLDRRQVRGVQGGADGARRHRQRRRPHRDHRAASATCSRAAASCPRRSSSSARWCPCRCGGANQKGSLNNQVSAVFVDLPVGARRPAWTGWRRSAGRWTSTRRRWGPSTRNSIIAMGDYVAPTLLSLGVRAGAAGRADVVPGGDDQRARPAGAALRARPADDARATAYVPIAGGTRCSIGIFSYLNTMTFGINADFDGYPDIDVLSGGIRRGIEELLAARDGDAGSAAEAAAEPARRTGRTTKPAKRARQEGRRGAR